MLPHDDIRHDKGPPLLRMEERENRKVIPFYEINPEKSYKQVLNNQLRSLVQISTNSIITITTLSKKHIVHVC